MPKDQKKTKKRSKPGQPSKLESPVTWRMAKALYEIGKTDAQVAEILEVKEQTINNWKRKEPQFFESLKSWKLKADEKVEKSLYERATGYSHPDIHISNYLGEITETAITKYYPPDTTAAIFWLCNRQPEKWKQKQDVNLSGAISLPELGLRVRSMPDDDNG